MFILTHLSDLLTIPPTALHAPALSFLTDAINAKYANKVIQRIGLCVALYDILRTSEGLIGNGTGAVNVRAEFRLVVFRPFRGEVLQGRIAGSGVGGIRVTMDFFDDIFVPPINLFEGSYYNIPEACYTWRTPDGADLFFDNNEVVRFRVEAETWVDVSPERQVPEHHQGRHRGQGQGQGQGQGGGEEGGGDDERDERRVPYSITGSMQQSGLGPTLWW